MTVKSWNGFRLLVSGLFHNPRQDYILTGTENLPSGMYFYKLETTGFSETKKMMLVK